MTVKVIELPNFVKLRTATQRRYVVLWTRSGEAHIDRRTDNLTTALAERRKHASERRDDDGRVERWYLVDLTTGQVVDPYADRKAS